MSEWLHPVLGTVCLDLGYHLNSASCNKIYWVKHATIIFHLCGQVKAQKKWRPTCDKANVSRTKEEQEKREEWPDPKIIPPGASCTENIQSFSFYFWQLLCTSASCCTFPGQLVLLWCLQHTPVRPAGTVVGSSSRAVGSGSQTVPFWRSSHTPGGKQTWGDHLFQCFYPWEIWKHFTWYH